MKRILTLFLLCSLSCYGQSLGIMGNSSSQQIPYWACPQRSTYKGWLTILKDCISRSNYANSASGTFYAAAATPNSRYGFFGGVALPDGRALFVPCSAGNIGLFDLASGTASGTFLWGPAHSQGANAYYGGVLANNGVVVLIPYATQRVGLFYNNPGGIGSFVAGPLTSGTNQYLNGTLGLDGNVYFAPSSAQTRMGIYSPKYNTFTLGADCPGNRAWSDAVVMPSGRICLVSFFANYLGIYDPKIGTAGAYIYGPTTGEGTSNGVWENGCLLPNGKVFLSPRGQTYIGLYDESTSASGTYARGPVTPSNSIAYYQGCCLLANGLVLMVHDANLPNLGLYDYRTNTYFVGPHCPISFSGSYPTGNYAYAGSVRLKNGSVVLIPESAPNIGVYVPAGSSTLPLNLLLNSVWMHSN